MYVPQTSQNQLAGWKNEFFASCEVKTSQEQPKLWLFVCTGLIWHFDEVSIEVLCYLELQKSNVIVKYAIFCPEMSVFMLEIS